MTRYPVIPVAPASGSGRVALTSSAFSTSFTSGRSTSIPIARVSFRGKSSVETFLLLPLVLPSVVLATGLLFLYLDSGLLGSTVGLILAHTMLATPYVMLIVAAALRGFDERLEWAALGLGAMALLGRHNLHTDIREH